MSEQIVKPIYVGFMRVVTLNFKLWCKPTGLGWRIKEDE